MPRRESPRKPGPQPKCPRGRPRKDQTDPSWAVRFCALEKDLEAQRRAAAKGFPLRAAQERGNTAALSYLKKQNLDLQRPAWRRWSHDALYRIERGEFMLPLPSDRKNLQLILRWLRLGTGDREELVRVLVRLHRLLVSRRSLYGSFHPEISEGALTLWDMLKAFLWALRPAAPSFNRKAVRALLTGWASARSSRFEGDKGRALLTEVFDLAPRIGGRERMRAFVLGVFDACGDPQTCEPMLADRAFREAEPRMTRPLLSDVAALLLERRRGSRGSDSSAI